MSTVSRLVDQGIAKPPRWLPSNICYETIMGSTAYGVSTDSSDIDIYGFCIPHRDDVFPHLRGDIIGFGKQQQRFEQYQEHHLQQPGTDKSYDVTIFSIVRYFQLAMENNPNILDSLFTSADCVLHTTKIGNMVRENRTMFVHKGCYPKLKGYAYSQLHKMKPAKLPEGKRRELVETYGYDIKFGYHVCRLLLQAEQLLTTGDMDLRRDREQLKSIRRGEWTENEIREWAADKERALETMYENSPLPWGPREGELKVLLINCLEEHFGSLSNVVINPDVATVVLRNIQNELNKVTHLL